MARVGNYSAGNPYVQAEPSFFAPQRLRKGADAWIENDGSLGRGEPDQGPRSGLSGGPLVGLPSAVPGVTAKLNSIELLEGSSAGGGIDGFEVAVIGRLNRGEAGGEDVYLETAARLEAAQVTVTEGKPNAFVEVMGATLSVSGRGSMWGDTWFRWFVEYDGIQIGLVKPDSKGSFAAKVQIRSLKLTRDGVRLSWAQAQRLLETLGVIVESTSVYQLDACIDLPGVKVDPFVESIGGRECVTRMKAESRSYRNADGGWQGADIGNRKGLFIRAYNKAHELDDRSGMESDAKRDALIAGRWGVDAADVTRIEIAMRGAWMRKHWEDCVTVEQVLENLPAMIDFVVTEFFRIVDGPVDRDNNNQYRAKASALWLDVCEVFRAVFGPGFELQRKRVKAFKVNVEHARRRLVAAAKSYAAALGPELIRSQHTMLQAVVNGISSVWDQAMVMPDLREKWDWMRSRVTADLRFEEKEPGSRAGAGGPFFPDSQQVPMERWGLVDRLVPF